MEQSIVIIADDTVTIPLERYDELITAEARLTLILASNTDYDRVDRGLIELIRKLEDDEHQPGDMDFTKEEAKGESDA